MPVYEYECTNCKEKFELRRSIGDSDSEIKCPACGAGHPQRVLSLFASKAAGGGACGPTSPT